MKTEEYIENYLKETEQIARQLPREDIAKAVELLKNVKDWAAGYLCWA